MPEEENKPLSSFPSSSSSSDLFPSSPGFTNALASIPLETPNKPILDLPTSSSSNITSSWAAQRAAFNVANRKRKRSLSPVGGGKGLGLGPRAKQGEEGKRYKKPTIDDIEVISTTTRPINPENAVAGPSRLGAGDMETITTVYPRRSDVIIRSVNEGEDDFKIDDRKTEDRDKSSPQDQYIMGRGNVGENSTESYVDSQTYAASKFGGIGQYMRNRRNKMQIQNGARANDQTKDEPQMFAGLAIYINGRVEPSLETLRTLILTHGGSYIPYLDRKSLITHIIATNLTPSKFKEFRNYKVVKPGWVVKSVENGKLEDWREWKLVGQGGMEDGMRKGLGGWMGGSQRVVKQKGKENVDEEEDGKEEEKEMEDLVELQEGRKSIPMDQLDDGIDGSEVDVPDSEQAISAEAEKDAPRNLVSQDSAIVLDSTPVVQDKPPLAQPTSISSTTPTKTLPATHTFLSTMSPNTLKSIVAPSKGQAPPLTTDPTTFEWTVASGYAKYQENKDAKRLMMDGEWRAGHTAVNEGFLEGYYQNSRLHHLSAWKAELKVLVAEAQKRAESNDTIRQLAPGASQAEGITGDSEGTLSLAKSVLPKASPHRNGPGPGGAQVGLVTGGGSGNSGKKVIFHVDFDAFFVSCGLATRPELKGQPVVVCHSQGGGGGVVGGDGGGKGQGASDRVVSDRGGSSTSEIASCSYEARAKGVKNGMSLGQARRLCPEVQTIPYEFETYKKFSLAFYTILMAYADELQAVSVDEALIDVSGRVLALSQAPTAFQDLSEPEKFSVVDGVGLDVDGLPSSGVDHEAHTDSSRKLPKDWAKELAEKIRADVRAATGCEVSIGISENILLARLATRHAKPAGSFHLKLENANTFLQDLDIGELPGFAYATKKKVEAVFGDTTCGALLAKTKGSLQACLGEKNGGTLFNFIRGIDDRKLEPHKERKSVSAEVNRIRCLQYGIRFVSVEEAEKFLTDLSDEVSKRLKAVSRKGRMLTLKVMVRHPDAPIEAPKFMGHGVCDVFNKSNSVANKRGGATDDGPDIANVILRLYRSQGFDAKELRGIGIQMQKLEGGAEEGIMDPAQRKLDFAKAAAPAFDPVQERPDRGMSPPPVVEEEDSDIEIVQEAPVTFRSKTRRDINSMTRQTTKKASAPPRPVPLTNHLTIANKFGRAKTQVKSREIERPESMLDFWPALDDVTKKEYRMAWKEKGWSIPVEMRARKGEAKEKPAETFLGVKAKARSRSPSAPVVKVKAKARSKSPPPIPKFQQQKLDVGQDRSRSRSRTPLQIAKEDIQPPPPPKTGKALQPFTTAAIEELGLNVDTVRELPVEIAAEIIAEERNNRRIKEQLTKKGRPVKMVPYGRATTKSPRDQKGQNMGKDVPSIQAHPPLRPVFSNLTAADDILSKVSEWMAVRGNSPPIEGEIRRLQKYLVRCVDLKEGYTGIGGMQDASRVLTWWRHLCRQRFRKNDAGGIEEREESKTVGDAWREAFRAVKREVDRVLMDRMGGGSGLSLG